MGGPGGVLSGEQKAEVVSRRVLEGILAEVGEGQKANVVPRDGSGRTLVGAGGRGCIQEGSRRSLTGVGEGQEAKVVPRDGSGRTCPLRAG